MAAEPRPPSAAGLRSAVTCLRERARTQPERLAFSLAEERLTYGQLYAASARLAAGLVRAGLRPGERVALALPAGLEFVAAYYAVQLAGAAPCAFAPGVNGSTLLRRISRARPALIWSEEPAHGELAAAAAGTAAIVTTSALQASVPVGAAAPPASIRPEDVAHLQLTSGTSGEPRVASVTYGATAAYLASTEIALEPTSSDRFVIWIPPWHDMGLYYGIVFPVVFGCESHLVEPSIATLGRWLETIASVGGTITAAPDFAYRLAVRMVEPTTVDLSCLRSATNGGEPVRLSTIEAFERCFGLHGVVAPAYGLAESNLGVTFTLPGRAPRVHRSGAVSSGPPMPGVEVRIRRSDGGVAAVDETGEVLVRSPSLFSGYLDAPADTAAALRDGWLHTGDAGFVDAHGELYVTGRRSNLLKRAGAALAPRELEEVAEQQPDVRMSAAVGIGDRIVLAVEQNARPAASAAELARAIATALRSALGFMPEILVLVPRTIPRTENGKIRHTALRAQIESGDLPRTAVLFDSSA